jgi:hypothetical protein
VPSFSSRPPRQPAFVPPIAQIVHERIHGVDAHVRVGFEIIVGLEIGAGIAAFAPSVLEIMEERVDAGAAHILVAFEIRTANRSFFANLGDRSALVVMDTVLCGLITIWAKPNESSLCLAEVAVEG